MTKKEAAIKEIKQARTIKIKTLVIGLIWFATVVTSFIYGGLVMSDVNAKIRGQVTEQLNQAKEAAVVLKADQ